MMTKRELQRVTVSTEAVSKDAVSKAVIAIHRVAGRITRVAMAAPSAVPLAVLLAVGLSACVTEPTVNAPWGTPSQDRASTSTMDRGGEG